MAARHAHHCLKDKKAVEIPVFTDVSLPKVYQPLKDTTHETTTIDECLKVLIVLTGLKKQQLLRYTEILPSRASHNLPIKSAAF